VLIGLVGVMLVTFLAFEGVRNPIARLFEPDTSTTDQNYLGLTNQDGYRQVVEKLGRPEREEWLSAEEADLQFQALFYPKRRYAIVLMGGERGDGRYIGAVHEPHRKVLDSARLSGGGDASAMMRNLPDF
jgi:hypothetical protein